MAAPNKNYGLQKNNNYLLNFPIFGSVISNLQSDEYQFFILNIDLTAHFCFFLDTAVQGGRTNPPPPSYAHPRKDIW